MFVISNNKLITFLDGEQEDKVTASDNRHILISHNWGKQPMVKQIYDGIKKNCISVWMHVHNIQGATVKAMVDAVDQAEIVLVCHSYKFKNSYNCRAGMFLFICICRYRKKKQISITINRN